VKLNRRKYISISEVISLSYTCAIVLDRRGTTICQNISMLISDPLNWIMIIVIMAKNTW
jgi:hypothetical protein